MNVDTSLGLLLYVTDEAGLNCGSERKSINSDLVCTSVRLHRGRYEALWEEEGRDPVAERWAMI